MNPENLQVRDGSPGDVQTLAAIEREAAQNPWSLSQFVSSSLRDNEHSLVLESPACGILGFLVYQRVLDEATLMNIAVSPACQARGCGSRLLEALLESLAADGVARCLLEVRRSNTAAIALYRRYGFVDDGVRSNYYPSPGGREDALLMSRELVEDA